MSLLIERADWFNEDFDRQFRWYLANASESIAERYFAAVQLTLQMLGAARPWPLAALSPSQAARTAFISRA